MKSKQKVTKPSKKERVNTLYDCCWYGTFEHGLCCGGFCAIPWIR